MHSLCTHKKCDVCVSEIDGEHRGSAILLIESIRLCSARSLSPFIRRIYVQCNLIGIDLCFVQQRHDNNNNKNCNAQQLNILQCVNSIINSHASHLKTHIDQQRQKSIVYVVLCAVTLLVVLSFRLINGIPPAAATVGLLSYIHATHEMVCCTVCCST